MAAKMASLASVLNAQQDMGVQFITSTTFSAAATVSVDKCFTSSFRNYRLLIDYTGSAAAYLVFRMRAASTDASGTDYTTNILNINGATLTGDRLTGQTSGQLIYNDATYPGAVTVVDMFSPALAVATHAIGDGIHRETAATTVKARREWNYHSLTTAYDGITIYPASGNITGTIAIYGYRNA